MSKTSKSDASVFAATRDDAAPLRFFEAQRLGPHQSMTAEGFLLCKDVPIARVGDMVYAAGELPLEPGLDGLITVHRGADELFNPDFIASLLGKPVVDEHPMEGDTHLDVTPGNWKTLARGTMHNIRPGAPPLNDCLLADLLITDADAIEDVRQGKRGVSLGYDAEYIQTAPGRGIQRLVTGNHVALTKTPRCGPRCSIGDSSMSKARLKSSTAASRDSLFARIRKAFNTRDTDELEAALADGEQTMADEGPDDKSGAVHVHVYGGDKPAAAPKAAGDEGGEGGEGRGETPEDQRADDARLKPIVDAIAGIGQRLEALEAKVNGGGDKTGDEGNEGPKGDTDPADDNDSKSKTGDSAALAKGWQDTIARAEILTPGAKVPTFDAKAPRVKTIDAMCGFRRDVLTRYGATPAGRDVLAAMEIDGIKDLSCDAVAIAFKAASDAQRAANNSGSYRPSRDSYSGDGRKGPPSPAEMNELHRKHYGKK